MWVYSIFGFCGGCWLFRLIRWEEYQVVGGWQVVVGEEFFRLFQDLLAKERVPEKVRPYYHKHLERWGLAFRRRPVGLAKQDFLDEYLIQLSHTAGVRTIEVRQTAEVVRLAHEVLLREDWARLVDWNGYRAVYRRDSFESQGEVVAETLDKLRDVWAAKGFPEENVDSLAALVRRLREGNYALRTEENYLQWVVRLMIHAECEVGLPGVAEAERFLSNLAVEGGVVMGTQKQALNALVFYLKRVRGFQQVDLRNFRKAKESQKLPVVLSKVEVQRLLETAEAEGRRGGLMQTEWAPMLQVMYASGLRVMECARLRVKRHRF